MDITKSITKKRRAVDKVSSATKKPSTSSASRKRKSGVVVASPSENVRKTPLSEEALRLAESRRAQSGTILPITASSTVGKSRSTSQRTDEATRRIFIANPFAKLATIDRGNLLNAIDLVTVQIHPKRIKMIAIMNALRYGMPWKRAIEFLQSYVDESKRVNAYTAYKEFVQRPDVKADIDAMKQFLNERKLGRDVINMYGFDVGRSGSGGGGDGGSRSGESLEQINEMIRSKYASILTPKTTTRSPKEFILPSFSGLGAYKTDATTYAVSGDERLGTCLADYASVSWSQYPVKRLLLRLDSAPGREFGIKDAIIKDASTGTEWVEANWDWFNARCAKGRDFEYGTIAYELKDGSVHVETIEDYQSFVQKVVTVQLVESRSANRVSIDIAKRMLEENETFSKGRYDSTQVLRSFIDAMAAGRRVLNSDIAKRISKILAYMSTLIDRKQVHIVRALRGQYRSDELHSLSKTVTLPEVYADKTGKNASVVKLANALVSRRRAIIEQNYYSYLVDGSNYVRVWTKTPVVAGVRPISVRKIDDTSLCSTTTQDVVYYSDADTDPTCYDRKTLDGVTISPDSGKPFDNWFLNDLSMIHDPVRDLDAIRDYERVVRDSFDDISPSTSGGIANELAPGLFSQLRNELAALNPIYCASCKTEMFRQRYVTIRGRNRVSYCSRHCMDGE